MQTVCFERAYSSAGLGESARHSIGNGLAPPRFAAWDAAGEKTNAAVDSRRLVHLGEVRGSLGLRKASVSNLRVYVQR
jgi:hypothetical protein